MTWGTAQKRHLLNRYKGCYQHTYPKGVSVHIRDHMQDLKYKVQRLPSLGLHIPLLYDELLIERERERNVRGPDAQRLPIIVTYPTGQGPNIRTVQEYLHTHILKHVRDVLNDESKGVHHYYGLLDRGGNLAKKLFTGHKRDRIPPMPDREDGRLSIPADGLLPVEWDNIVANRRMANCEIKPLYFRALIQVPFGRPFSERQGELTHSIVCVGV